MCVSAYVLIVIYLIISMSLYAQQVEIREMFSRILTDAAHFSGGRYRVKPEDIPSVLAYVQVKALEKHFVPCQYVSTLQTIFY